MTKSGSRSTLALRVLAPFLLSALAPASEEAAVAFPTDCGARALYLLLAIQGRERPLAELYHRLAPPSREGYSLQALRDTARQLRLNLDGVQLDCGVHLEQPALILLKRGRHGHFAVVRPVGFSGQLVQVLDPNRQPQVVDWSELCSDPGWTGRALIPRTGWTETTISMSAAGILGLSLIFGALVVHRRPRRAGGPPALRGNRD